MRKNNKIIAVEALDKFQRNGRPRASTRAAVRQKRQGKRFTTFCRDTRIGDPGDPLIGFPILNSTENPKLTTENW